MLQRQESEENTPLAERRVTTEEFTQAVTSLEARKEAERQRLAGTVPIAETVQELGIDAQPDEIWAEVQAQRAKQAAAHVPPQNQAPVQQTPARSYDSGQSLFQNAPRRQRRFRWFPILLVVWLATRLFSPHHRELPATVDTGSPSVSQSASIHTLAEIPNGKTVYCDYQTLAELHQGRPLSQVLVQEARAVNNWPLVKYEGHVYLRGYMLPLSDQAMKAQPFKVDLAGSTPDDSAGNAMKQITIRLDQTDWQKTKGNGRSEGDWGDITVSHTHLDSHARESWDD